VVEGYTDVMACHLAGVTTAVATCGTAFGDDHIKVLNRILVTDAKKPAEVIFNFDPDEAGQKAAMRAFASAQKFNAMTYIAIGPDGLDPCDLRQERGDDAIVSMIAAKRPLVEFAIERSIAAFDLASREGQVAAVRAAASIVAEIADPVLRSSYEKHLSELTLVDRAAVNQMVGDVAKGIRRQAVIPQASTVVAPETPAAGYAPVNLNDPINRRERWLLEVVAQLPQFCDLATLQRIFRTYFSAPRHLAIAKVLLKEFGEPNSQDAVSGQLQDELASTWREILMARLPIVDEAGAEQYAKGVVGGALLQTVEFEKQFLIQALTQAQAAQKSEDASVIAKKLVDLDTELVRLRAER
jgi:DNA primase